MKARQALAWVGAVIGFGFSAVGLLLTLTIVGTIVGVPLFVGGAALVGLCLAHTRGRRGQA